MQLVNLNKHDINVSVNGEIVIFPPSGQVATVSVKSVADGEIVTFISDAHLGSGKVGIPVVKSVYGAIEGLPAPQADTLYIVNLLVGPKAASELGRTDLIGPDSGPTAIRENGQVKAVTQFVRF